MLRWLRTPKDLASGATSSSFTYIFPIDPAYVACLSVYQHRDAHVHTVQQNTHTNPYIPAGVRKGGKDSGNSRYNIHRTK